MKWIPRLVVVVGLLVVGRELHVRQVEITAVAGDIDAERDAIDRAETRLADLERDLGAADDGLRLLDGRITAIERRHPRGIPPSEYGAYQRVVAERNALARRQNELVAEQRALMDEYGRRVAAHNARVEDATAIARRGTPAAVVRELWGRLAGAD